MKTTCDEQICIEPKTEISTVIFFNSTAPFNKSERCKVMSIELSDDYTRIDFEYLSPHHYENGGWIEMNPRSFIRIVGSEVKYPLLRTENIPISPNKYFFKACGVKHYYSLFFAALPKDTSCIDIIEREAPGNYFNFYDVSLKQQGIICVDGNKLN
ncbi:MAG: hypothetical protein IPH24_17770 [Crocinitomicaceae bacterium]|nr:hypothetical protein [Crocinitomicaceae bacterium]